MPIYIDFNAIVEGSCMYFVQVEYLSIRTVAFASFHIVANVVGCSLESMMDVFFFFFCIFAI